MPLGDLTIKAELYPYFEYLWYYKSKGLLFTVDKNEKEVWAMMLSYNPDSKRLNLNHRLVSKDAWIKWSQLLALIQWCVAEVYDKLPEVKWYELFISQKSVLERTERNWFALNSERSTNVWLYDSKPELFTPFNGYLENRSSPSLEGIIGRQWSYINGDVITKYNHNDLVERVVERDIDIKLPWNFLE